MQREFCIVAVGIVRPERPVRHRRFSLPFDAPDQRAAPPHPSYLSWLGYRCGCDDQIEGHDGVGPAESVGGASPSTA